MKELHDGLAILLKYETKGSTYAEHDIIYAGGGKIKTQDSISQEDQKEMKRLGWHWDKEYDCWAMFT